MRKTVTKVSLLAALLFAAFAASAQNSAAPADPKAVAVPDNMQAAQPATTDASSAADRAKSSNAAAPAPIPEGGKTITVQKNDSSKEELYRGDEKITPRPDTFRKTSEAAPPMKELNPQIDAKPKTGPKPAAPTSQG